MKQIYFSRTGSIASMLLVAAGLSYSQTPLPVLATGFCSTGLTPKAPQPYGCQASKLVNPINPTNGGPIVDGNWELAVPFPSAPITQPAPSPCAFSANYLPAPVSAPEYFWFNPNDQLSQWIEPNGGENTPEGWYIYRTGFVIPGPYPGYSHYELVLNGQFVADDKIVAIYLEDSARSNSCRPVETFTSSQQGNAWNKLKIVTGIAPQSTGYLYVVMSNAPGNPGQNPTGMRLEFTSPYLYPF